MNVTLIDGTEVDCASEAWRHECEARHVANLPTREARQDYIAGITKKRGEAAGHALRSLATEIYTSQRKGAHA